MGYGVGALFLLRGNDCVVAILTYPLIIVGGDCVIARSGIAIPEVDYVTSGR